MSSQVLFTWRSNQGIGILVSLVGWSLLFQVIPIIHAFEVLNFGSNLNEQIIILTSILLTSVILTALISSILENLSSEDELYSKGLGNFTFPLVIILGFYEFGYLFALPIMEFLSPFLSLDIISQLSGINAYIASVVISLTLTGIVWGISEFLPTSK
ncbi:MAG: hypothetical protein ACW981_07790 [Candidatus Hodarchaeales archaeon]|jgi:hypothetical protein